MLQADVQLSNAAQILITIHSCEGLTLQQAAGQAVVQRPYVHYIPPGRDVGHDTAVGSGPAAVYNDTASWPLVRTASVQQALRHQPLQVSEHKAACPAFESISRVAANAVGQGGSAGSDAERHCLGCRQEDIALCTWPLWGLYVVHIQKMTFVMHPADAPGCRV